MLVHFYKFWEFRESYGMNGSVLPNLYFYILMPHIIVLGGGALVSLSGHEAGSLKNGICALIKENILSPLDSFSI